MGEFFALLTAAFLQYGNPVASASMPPQYFAVMPPAPELSHHQFLLSAPTAMISDLQSGQILWEQDARTARPMASLTKLMTALLILENHDLSEIASVPLEAVQIEGSKMGLYTGEQISVRALLQGLLIRSANDAAITLAIYDAGSSAEFVQKMNRRTRSLGMKQTQFANSHGLDEEGHFSTAADLHLLAQHVWKFSFVRQTVQTARKAVSSADGTISHDLLSTNLLLTGPFPVTGLKTGTTDEAGQCLLLVLRYKNHDLLFTVLGSTDRFYDVKTLFAPFL